MSPSRARLQTALGHVFRDPALLEQALTHRSWQQEALAGGGEAARLRERGRRRSGRRDAAEASGPPADNETLEFLGDAILGFVVAESLRQKADPEAEVGWLSRRRSSLVSEASLAPRARRLGLGEALRLGRGEEGTGGRDKASLLADAFEAVVAAIYLDGGMRAARAFIHRQFPEGFDVAEGGPEEDPKTRLQEHLQAGGKPLPEYRLVAEEGPEHARSFTVEVVLDGESLARGTGRTKKAAGAEAARAALAGLGLGTVSAGGARSPRAPRRRGGGSR